MSKNNVSFVKETEKNKNRNNSSNATLNMLLVPVSIVLAGVLVMVGILISAVSIKKEVVDIKAQLAKIQSVGGTTTAAQPTQQQPTVTIDQVKDLFKQDVIKFGDENRKVLFVEFSDPSCPYCHIAGGKNPELNKSAGSQFVMVKDGGTYVAPVEEMKKLVDEGKASFIWAYSDGHGAGQVGTKALYCAHEKGKFWPVHDLLMSSAGYSLINDQVKNDMTKASVLAEFTKSAMDAGEMQRCLESGKYDNVIARDQQLANSFGASGTPGFFVNTTNYAGAYSYKDMEATVNSALGN